MGSEVFFSRARRSGVRTGREMLSGLLWGVFSDSVKAAGRIDAAWIEQSPIKALLLGLRGWLDGLDKSKVDECIASFGDGSGTLFIDGSNYGRLGAEVKRQLPGVAVVTFFHNVEAWFFWDAFLQSKSLRSLMVALCNYYAERKAFANSDILVFLNKRDADLASRIYRHRLCNSRIEIFPMCLEDHPKAEGSVAVLPIRPLFGLFVGGAFYANVQGMRWYAENVAPFLTCMTFVVGKGFEQYREELESHGGVTVIGTVGDVADWYERATFIISPIFKGSGMKTKTAEAAQFGRPILGTPEAFAGFEEHIDQLGLVCSKPRDFINAVSNIVEGNLRFDANQVRSIFVKNYSQSAASRRMTTLLEAFSA